MKLTKRTIRVGHDIVHYQVAGEGLPVIMVHGLSASSLWWRRNVLALAQSYKVYLLDLPGFGSMRRFAYRFAIDDATALLLAWMQEMHIERATFIAHSMGGYMCLWLAAYHPEVVERLVLVSPAGVPYRKSVGSYLRPLLREMLQMRLAFAPILFYDALRAGLPTLMRAVRDLISKDVRTFLEKVHVPTLLVWGEHDSLVPALQSAILRDTLENSRLLILKNAGHIAMFDQAEQFNQAVLAFLRGEMVGS
ncbi:MAG: alpha/beta hydrolase [Chloroflexota bacterium]|nr:alpha/beta hydrolase [Chloroflexota bacterium]